MVKENKTVKETKTLYWSRTFWVNFVVVVIAAIVGVSNSSIIVDFPALVPWFAGVIGTLNIVLRLVTKTPIEK